MKTILKKMVDGGMNMSMVYKCDRCGKIIEKTFDGGGNGPFVWDGTLSKDQENADLCEDCYNSLVQWLGFKWRTIRLLEGECCNCRFSNFAEHVWPCNNCIHNCVDHWEAKNDQT